MRGPVVIVQRLPAASRRQQKGHHGNGHHDRGAAAVEMALVMPLLILMIMGIIDFGRIFNGEIQLSQAAREGARIAALGTSGSFTVQNVIARTEAALTNPAFQGNPPFGTAGLASGCSASPTSCILVDVVPVDPLVGPAASQGTVCQPTDAATGNSQVTVTIPYSKILFGPATLSQKAVMKCSG